MATDVLELISKDEKERTRYESELIFDLDRRSQINGARREGRAEGKIESLIRVARNLYKRGVSFEQISEDTGLSVDEIRAHIEPEK